MDHPSLARRSLEPAEGVGGPLAMRAILRMPATDRVSLFNEEFGFDPHKRPL